MGRILGRRQAGGRYRHQRDGLKNLIYRLVGRAGREAWRIFSRDPSLASVLASLTHFLIPLVGRAWELSASPAML